MDKGAEDTESNEGESGGESEESAQEECCPGLYANLVTDASANPDGTSAYILGFGWGTAVGVLAPLNAIFHPVQTAQGLLILGSPYLTTVNTIGIVTTTYTTIVSGNGIERGRLLGEVTIGLAAGGGVKALGLGKLAGSLTSADGFLIGGVTIKTPFNIPVQRFGEMSLGRSDFWGLRIGTSKFANRTFGAIRPEWNNLTQYTTGTIPKGTTIKLGIIGPQGWLYPGGSLQFITSSRGVVNQSSKLIGP